MIFTPVTINKVELKNRIVRSSIGGRTAYYEGTVNEAWTNFEKRFAGSGVAGIISATFTVDEERWSPIEYPKISHDRFIPSLRKSIGAIKAAGDGCRYIMQLGDSGSHTQTSLFSQRADGASASALFDFLYGYRNLSYAMTVAEVEGTVEKFAEAARRVREIGCEGVEITASKGYLIHQFLNPVTNRRTDKYGGSPEKRFQLLHDVVSSVRKKIGTDFLVGVRLSAADVNFLPFPNPRLPLMLNLRHYVLGNGLRETVAYAKRLKDLGVDYLHVDSGFGFINPRGNPGAFPIDELRMFMNSTRHLGGKAAARAIFLNVFPTWLLRLITGWGWTWDPSKVKQGGNARYARAIRSAVGIPVIANGGFRDRERIEEVLRNEDCDLVAMARALLANPRLLETFRGVADAKAPPCTFCNKCAARTALFPLGCYDVSRFKTDSGTWEEAVAAMERQILDWARP